METLTIDNSDGEKIPIDSNLDRKYYEIKNKYKTEEGRSTNFAESKIHLGVSNLSRKKSLNTKKNKRVVFNWKFEMKKPNDHFQLTPVINSMEKKLKRLIKLRDKMKVESKRAIELSRNTVSPSSVNRSSRSIWTVNNKNLKGRPNNIPSASPLGTTVAPGLKSDEIMTPTNLNTNPLSEEALENEGGNVPFSLKVNYIQPQNYNKQSDSRYSNEGQKIHTPPSKQSNKSNEISLNKAEEFNKKVFKEIGSQRDGNKLVNEICRLIQIQNADAPPVDKKKQTRQTKYYINKCIELIRDMKITMIRTAVARNRFDDFDNKVARTKEFISRFLRLYTYPMLQHVSEIEACEQPEKSPLTYLKLTSMYKIIYTGLDACNKNIPSIVGVNFKEKLEEFLDCILEICEMNIKYIDQKHLQNYRSAVEELKELCEEQLKKLDENVSIPSVDSVVKVIKYKKPPKVNRYNIQRGRKKPVKHYSAYYTPSPWKQKLNKKKPRLARKEGHRLDDPKTMTFLRNLPIVIATHQAKYQEVIMQAKKNNADIRTKQTNKNRARKIEKKGNTAIKREQMSKEEAIRKYIQIIQEAYEKTESPDSELINTIMFLEKCLDLNLNRKKTNIYDPCKFTAPPNSPKQPCTPTLEEETLSRRKLKLYVRK